jgi:hypothetical protein
MNKFNNAKRIMLPIALMLSALVAGCGSGDGGGGFPRSSVTAAGAGTGAGAGGRGPAPVNLGSAANFRILAKTAVTDIPLSAVTGEVGLGPGAPGTAITGLTCPEVNGGVGTPIHVASTAGAAITSCSFIDPALGVAIGDADAAFVDASGRAPDYNELGAGIIGGLNLGPATYKWTTAIQIPSTLTLTGGANDVWIFVTSGNISIASNVQIILAGGALPQNIYWATSSAADLATSSTFKGTVISATGIDMKTGATINGRLLAATAVTLDHNTVSP